MINVLLDTSPLHNANSIRGVGMYTRFLTAELEHRHDLHLLKSVKGQPAVEPDLIHYPFFHLFFDTLPLWKPIPTIVTIHDVIPLLFPEYYPSGLKGQLRFLKQKAALSTVSAVITDSKASEADIVKHLGIPTEKVHVVYLAANPEIHKTSAVEVEKAQRRWRLPAKYVLYVGDINYNKNVPQLIKAVSFLPKDIHLVCVGKNFKPHPIPEWQWIETQLAASQVEKRVHFLTEIEGSDTVTLSALYTGALCYVQPSLYEGFGLPILEAMQCRTPVIASSNSSLIEVVGEYGVLVEPTAEIIADTIRLVADWSLTERQKRTSAAYAWSQTFTWQKTAAETIKVYQKVLNQRQKAPAHAEQHA